jgi:hypothetical protein
VLPSTRPILAESSIKMHLTSIIGKLGVGPRSEAAAIVLDPEQKLGCGILGLLPGAPIVPGRESQYA